MKKREFLTCLAVAFFFQILTAQQLTPSVISSSGGFYSNTSGMLSFTTAEMSAVETYSSAASILTQGFQQPWDFGTLVKPIPESDFLFGLQPNPSNGDFVLVTHADPEYHIEWKILDMLGKQLLSGKYNHTGPVTIQPIDFTSALPGTYVIALTMHEYNTRPSTYTVQKIQIIR